MEFLHDLGVALHYPEVDNGMRVLNPTWLSKGVYDILISKIAKDQNGRIRLSDLQRILEIKNYPQKTHEFILKTMVEFELAFFDEGVKDWVIPDCMPEDRPDQSQLDVYRTKAVLFRYRFDFLPPGILGRLMTKISYDVVAEKCWLKGVVLENTSEKSQALLIEDTHGRTVDIWAGGERQAAYLSKIRHCMEQIFSGFKDFGVEEQIPLYRGIFDAEQKLPPANEMDFVRYPDLLRKEYREEEYAYDERNIAYPIKDVLD